MWKMISRLQKVLCMAQAMQNDWMWPSVETYGEIFNQKWPATFPQKCGFWCDYVPCTGAAQRVCLTSWIYKTIYFWKAKTQGFGMNLKKKYLDQPIISWPFLSPARFQAQLFPKFWAVWSIRKNFMFNWGSFQSYTINVSHAGCFTRLWNPFFFVGCVSFVLDDVIRYRWFILGHFGILCLEFELCNSVIVISRNIVPSFI